MLLPWLAACNTGPTQQDSAKEVDTAVDSPGDTAAETGDSTSDTDDSTADSDSCAGVDIESDLTVHADALSALIDGVADDCVIEWYLGKLDEREECEGPWNQETFVSWSPDGVTFDLSDAQSIFTETAVLDAIIGPDGRYYLIFGEGDLDVGRTVATTHSTWFATHGLIGTGALSAAVSDDGVTFERIEDFAVDGLVRGMVVDPDIVRMPSGTYRMYYVATDVVDFVQPGAWDDGAPHQAYFAESDDLIHWHQVRMAVNGPNADPTVWCGDDDHCVMASTGMDWSESNDGGESWTFEYRQDPFGFAPEFHELEDGRLRMFFNSKVRGGALESSVSSDGGRTFVPEGEVLPGYTVEAISLAPAPAELGGYYLYYHYWEAPYSGDYWEEHGCGVW